MEITESTFEIGASVQTVWSILDDLPRYGEWNPILPNLKGRTTVGEVVSGDLVIPGMPTPPLSPTITRIVALRELRWLSVYPGPEGFSAEHIFELEPTERGTKVVHREVFDGPAAGALAPAIHSLVRDAYDNFDAALTARAEEFAKLRPVAHPSISLSVRTSSSKGALNCKCAEDRVEVAVSAPLTHNHLCGCSKCWKPDGAMLAQIAVAPSDAVEVRSGHHKLAVVDEAQSIKRHACKACGVHMVGTVEDVDHHFYGISFVHPELAVTPITGKPEFAGFVASIVENGECASNLEGLHRALGEAGIPAFDSFSPEIDAVISYHKQKLKSTTSSRA